MKMKKNQILVLQLFFYIFLRHNIRLGVVFWHFQSDLRPLNMRSRLLYAKFGAGRLKFDVRLPKPAIVETVGRP